MTAAPRFQPVVPRLADPARRRLHVQHAYRLRRREMRVDRESYDFERPASARALLALFGTLLGLLWLCLNVGPLLEGWGW